MQLFTSRDIHLSTGVVWITFGLIMDYFWIIVIVKLLCNNLYCEKRYTNKLEFN